MFSAFPRSYGKQSSVSLEQQTGNTHSDVDAASERRLRNLFTVGCPQDGSCPCNSLQEVGAQTGSHEGLWSPVLSLTAPVDQAAPALRGNTVLLCDGPAVSPRRGVSQAFLPLPGHPPSGPSLAGGPRCTRGTTDVSGLNKGGLGVFSPLGGPIAGTLPSLKSQQVKSRLISAQD